MPVAGRCRGQEEFVNSRPPNCDERVNTGIVMCSSCKKYLARPFLQRLKPVKRKSPSNSRTSASAREGASDHIPKGSISSSNLARGCQKRWSICCSSCHRTVESTEHLLAIITRDAIQTDDGPSQHPLTTWMANSPCGQLHNCHSAIQR